jgi:hypothetical protein
VGDRAARRTARFVYLSDAEPHSSLRNNHGHHPPRPVNVAWRIVAANNRPLGRSAACYSTLSACVDSAFTLQAEIDRTVSAISFDTSSGHWRWTLTLDRVAVAVCVHVYERRIECVRSLAQFATACRVADPSPDEVRHLGVHAMHGYKLVAPSPTLAITSEPIPCPVD